MENLREPLEDGDAVNKKYVDGIVEDLTLKQGLVRENGGFNLVDSYINMNFNNIRNVGYPKHNEDAVPRSFVDNMIKEVEEKINKRKQLIAANASYYGDLIKGEYQFTWGGQSIKSYIEHDKFNGFLVPSSGYIKKFIFSFTGIKLYGLETIFSKEKKHYPLFTFFLIRQNVDPLDIGTLYFYIVNNDDIINLHADMNSVFKFNPDFEEKTLRTVREKDIINIRTEFTNKGISEEVVYSIRNNNYDFFTRDFFTYLATLLIELDPL